MFKILKSYGCCDKIINQISATYIDTKAKVLTSDGLSDAFRIEAGVLQGDTLAPCLFIWIMDYVLRCAVDETGIGYTLK